jgi:hypothetical protein
MRKLLLASAVERVESSCCIFFPQGIKIMHSCSYLKQTELFKNLSFSLNKLSDQLRLVLTSKLSLGRDIQKHYYFMLFCFYIILILNQISGYLTLNLTSLNYKNGAFQLQGEADKEVYSNPQNFQYI